MKKYIRQDKLIDCINIKIINSVAYITLDKFSTKDVFIYYLIKNNFARFGPYKTFEDIDSEFKFRKMTGFYSPGDPILNNDFYA